LILILQMNNTIIRKFDQNLNKNHKKKIFHDQNLLGIELSLKIEFSTTLSLTLGLNLGLVLSHGLELSLNIVHFFLNL
jgi:hypothetical protein